MGVKDEAPDVDFSIGLLEVSGLVCSIVGLDAMLKAADVRLIHTEKRLGGRLVTLIIKGKVSAVKAAIEAGVNEAKPLGKVHGNAVIASPHGEIMKFFDYEVE
ncbi:MAG: BMC domain-containing protein [Clostridia bacterium]|nr:BMC domain-containing protein [Clostridia bacterium]